MKRKLVVRPQAQFDRAKHCLYLYEHNPQVVDRFDRAVQDAIKRIKQDPRGHATLVQAGLPDAELRFCRPRGFKNYLVVYQVTDDYVFVLRILHGSQDIEAALRL
jgi:plasmid stabilization system protein ParE